jgi:hypothetical protein
MERIHLVAGHWQLSYCHLLKHRIKHGFWDSTKAKGMSGITVPCEKKRGIQENLRKGRNGKRYLSRTWVTIKRLAQVSRWESGIQKSRERPNLRLTNRMPSKDRCSISTCLQNTGNETMRVQR